MDETVKTILLILFGLIFVWPLIELFGGLLLLMCIPILLIAFVLFIPFGIIGLLLKMIKAFLF